MRHVEIFREVLRFRRKIVSIGLPVLVSQGSLIVWGFFSILVIRILPSEAYAAYSVARSVQIFSVMLGGSFVMQSIVKYISEDNSDRERKIANAGIVLAMAMAVLIAILLVSTGNLLQSFYSEIDLRGIPMALAILVITSTASMLPQNLLAARHRTREIMWSQISSTVVRILVVSVFILTDSLRSPIQIFEAMIAGNLASMMVGFIFVRDMVSFSLGLEKEHIKMLFGFAVVSLGAGIAGNIYTRTDILLLGKMVADTEVSGYAASRTLTALVDNINMAAKIVVLPLFSRMWNQGQRDQIVKRVMSTILIISLIQLPAIVLCAGFPGRVLHTLYGGKYDAAWPVLMILGFITVIKPFGSIFSCMSVAIGKPSYSLYSVLTSASINVGMNLLLIPRYGGLGAALATGLSIILGALVVIILSLRQLRRGRPGMQYLNSH
ncbi:MAG: oligosaccharide flippase family protein [Candidatus Aegiribacteria sp.]|nr:oligosaccharide flippase family protein [Candidatus Aegiribacteria sp.]